MAEELNFQREWSSWLIALGNLFSYCIFRLIARKYNPIERCWGILEQHWNGALLSHVDTMLAWAQSMTWKGRRPIIHLSQKVYHKGISLTKKAMEEIEMRLLRNPHLPKWDILIRPCYPFSASYKCSIF